MGKQKHFIIKRETVLLVKRKMSALNATLPFRASSVSRRARESLRRCSTIKTKRRFFSLSTASATEKEELKKRKKKKNIDENRSIQLLRLINDTKQKRNDDGGDDESRIIALMDALETEQKNAEKDIDLINGSFSLLFTGGATETSEREREAKEGQIGSLLTKVTGSSSSMKKVKTKNSPSSSSSKNFQIIDLASERVENRADLLLFNRIPVSVRIFGSCVRNSAIPSSSSSVSPPSMTRPRFLVCFTHAKIEIAGKERIRIPLKRFNAQGWIEVTYVDELIRLGIGDKGSRFVTARLREKTNGRNDA